MGGKNRTAQNLKVLKIDTVHNLIYLKGSLAGCDEAFVRVTDAVRKGWFGKTFPQGSQIPFPTMLKKSTELPRELIYTPPERGVDPFSRQMREKNG